MRFEPSPEALTSLFERVVPTDPDVRRRKMFGWPAAFVGGNMFASLHREAFVLRLPREEMEEVHALGGRAFEPMPGRPMKGYVVVPDAILADEAAIAAWVGRALAFGRSLPPK